MSRIRYKAIYPPENNRRAERQGYKVIDANRLADVPSGYIVLYRLYKDGSAKVHSGKSKKTAREQEIFEHSQVYLEPKHDG